MSHQLHESPPGGLFERVPAPPVRFRESVADPIEARNHPLFSLMNAATQGRLLVAGRCRTIEAGAQMSISGCVAFVQAGLIGTVSRPSGVCVSVAGAGAVLGLASAFDAPKQGQIVALTATRVFAAPLAVLIEGLGRNRVMELCMRQSLECLSAMETEAACNAAHLVPQRMARWLLRLHRANREDELRLTQGELARLMGVQRTSVNVAARRLQRAGAARFTRGRIVIRDLDCLIRSSCRCPV